MSRAFKAAALGLVIVAVVWAFTLWRWHDTAQQVSDTDIAVRLGLLPLALTAVALLAWWGASRLRKQVLRPVEPATPGLTPATAQAPTRASDGDLPGAPERPQAGLDVPMATVLAEAVTLAAGHGAEAAWMTLKDAGMRPGLDPELRDADGLPIFSARVTDLSVTDWLLAHAELGPPEAPLLPEPVLRALALLEAPLHDLVMAAVSTTSVATGATGVPGQGHAGAGSLGASDVAEGTADGTEEGMADGGSLPQHAPSHLSGVGRTGQQARARDQAARAPVVQVRLWLPPAWDEPQRSAALDWLRGQCGALLDWTDQLGAAPPAWQLAPTDPRATPESLWSDLGEVLSGWPSSPRPHLMLLLAADTALDADTVMQWQARGELFTGHHQRGRVPGEAAAGLLLCNPAWERWAAAIQGGGAAQSPRLWSADQVSRERSADAIGRVGCDATQSLLARVAERAALHAERPVPADADWLLVSDGDHRASRTAEVFEALLAVRPHTDPMISVVRAGEACGDVGLARALVPVALTSAALRLGEPVALGVALMVQDAWRRVAVPLTLPAPMPTPAIDGPMG